jgi:multiple sugar transport system permease protein
VSVADLQIYSAGALLEQAAQVSPWRSRRRYGILTRGAAGLLALPALVVVSGGTLYALVEVIRLSLLHEDFLSGGVASFAGWSNFAAILVNGPFLNALERSVFFTVPSVIGQLCLGLGLAILTQSGSRSMKVCRAAIAVPWAMPPIVVAIVWRFLYLPGASPVASILSFFGLQQGILAAPAWALGALVLANIWEFTPLYFLFLSAGVQGLSPAVLEASQVDGSSRIQQIRFIIVPQLRPLLATLAAVDILSSMAIFDLIWVMTQGGPTGATETGAIYVYQLAFQSYEFGEASAAVVVMALASLVLAGLAYFVVKGRAER